MSNHHPEPDSVSAATATSQDANPFRPTGDLSHSVEPIVESYRHRPFPDHVDYGESAQSTAKDSSMKKKIWPWSRSNTTDSGDAPPGSAKLPAGTAEVQVSKAAPGRAQLVHIDGEQNSGGAQQVRNGSKGMVEVEAVVVKPKKCCGDCSIF